MKHNHYLLVAILMLLVSGLCAQNQQKEVKKEVVVISVKDMKQEKTGGEGDVIVKVDVLKEDGVQKIHMIHLDENGKEAEFSWEGKVEEMPDFLKDYVVIQDERLAENGEQVIKIEVKGDEDGQKKECEVIIRIEHDMEEDLEELSPNDFEQEEGLKGEHWKETEQQLAPIPESISAGEELGLQELEFYPVPTNAKVQLRFKTEPGPVSVNVYDQNGRSIYAENVKGFDGYYQGEIDLSGNPSGTYFLQINQQGRVHIERLILQE